MILLPASSLSLLTASLSKEGGLIRELYSFSSVTPTSTGPQPTALYITERGRKRDKTPLSTIFTSWQPGGPCTQKPTTQRSYRTYKIFEYTQQQFICWVRQSGKVTSDIKLLFFFASVLSGESCHKTGFRN